jgi:hypothetical protein
MKLTPDESTLINLISNMPGQSYCPGADSRATPEVNRIIRRLERKGLLAVTQTDDGYRYSLAGGDNAS